VAELDHRGTRCGSPLVVFAVPSAFAVPGVGPLDDPPFVEWRKTFRAFRPRFDFDVPRGSVLFQPGVQGMIVILVVAEDGLQSRDVLRIDLSQQLRSRRSVVGSRAGDDHRDQQAERIDQQMSLAPLDFLAPVVAALRAADLGGLRRLAVDARGAGRRFATGFDADSRSQRVHHRLPHAIVAPLGEVVVDRALRQQVVRQHVPLAARAIEVQQSVHHFPHVGGSRTPAVNRPGSGNQRLQDGPLFVSQIRGIGLPRVRGGRHPAHSFA